MYYPRLVLTKEVVHGLIEYTFAADVGNVHAEAACRLAAAVKAS